MKDEIKEILDNVKKCCDITKEQSFTVYQRQDILKLLDLITNLQEEVKSANESITWWQNRFNALQEENEELKQKYKNKEYLRNTRLDDNYITIPKLKYKNITDLQIKTIKENKKLEERINKAIEYIRNHQLVFELSSKKQIQDWFDMFYKDSINILKGEDNE